jgi:hypothetical protein
MIPAPFSPISSVRPALGGPTTIDDKSTGKGKGKGKGGGQGGGTQQTYLTYQLETVFITSY